jgi:hypothetical protein
MITLALLSMNSNAATVTVSAIDTQEIGPGFDYAKHNKKSNKIKRKNRRGPGCPQAYNK